MGFLAWLIGCLGPIGTFIATLIKAQGPAPIVVESEKAGQEASALATAQQDVKAAQAVAQAETNAPKTQAAVVQSLKDGTF